jgi:CHRD domain-containing protein
MTKRLMAMTIGAVLIVGGGSVASAQEKDLANNVKATLIGFEENPSISTAGSGSLDLKIDDGKEEISFTLTYGDLEGVAPTVPGGVVTAAHIHISRPSVNGGVVAFLCGGGGKPACPISGTITGTITEANIVGPAAQGIDPGESTAFEEFVAAIRAGYSYVNVHTTRWPGGEIRGQIK